MKIDASLSPGSAPAVETSKRSAKPVPQVGSESDVKISELSSQLQARESQQGSAVVDNAKVAAIKQAIAEGRFNIKAGAIADSLISSAQELLKNKRSA